MSGPAIGLVVLLGLLAILCIPLGLVIFVLGLRGKRTGVVPTCARCNFDLAGIATSPDAKCPECGTRLEGKIVAGRRVRRVGMMFVGACILIVSLSAVIAMLSSGGWVRLNAYKPVFILRTEMFFDGGLREPAIRELNSRLATGSLSQQTVDAIVRKALELQSDDTRRWQVSLGDFVETAHAKGKTTEEAWRQYVLTAIKPRLDVTTRISQGESIASDLKIGPGRVSQSFQMSVISKIDELLLDGKPLTGWESATGMTITSPLTSTGSAWQSRKIELKHIPPGQHELAAKVTSVLADDPGCARTESVKFVITILPNGVSTHTLAVDPVLRSLVTSGLSVQYLRFRQTSMEAASVEYSITFTSFPVNAAFDIFVNFLNDNGDKAEIKVGAVSSRRMKDNGQMGHAGGNDIVIDDASLRRIASAGTLEVELRPSLDVAKAQTNLYEIWGESVTLRATPQIQFLNQDSK